jgi:2OG-Fe(II) oxygenase superfamily
MEGISDRTSTVLSWLRGKVSLTESVEDLCERFQTAQPYPHVVLDNLFPSAVLDGLLDELPPMTNEKWIYHEDEQLVKWNLRSPVELGETAFQLSAVLNSAAFLYLLREITGIEALLPDPYLAGGAYTVYPEGGKFDVHVDRNTADSTGLTRRLAFLIYLNHSWKEEYGGQLELWNQEGTQCDKVIAPIFNRAVIFEIGDKNFHGVRPVVEGSGFVRRAFSLYYHTVGKDIVAHNSLYAPSLYQDKHSLLRRVVKDSLPPFLWRGLKRLQRVN